MINLLPQRQKEELKEEESRKLIIVWAVFVCFFAVSFVSILLSIRNYISGKIDFQKIALEQKEEELENPQIQSLRKNLVSFNATLSDLEAFYRDQAEFSETLISLSRIVPANIYLANISFSKKDGGATCNISGFSPDRKSLLELKNNLEKTFQEINFPQSNWLEPEDINFTASLKIDGKKE